MRLTRTVAASRPASEDARQPSLPFPSADELAEIELTRAAVERSAARVGRRRPSDAAELQRIGAQLLRQLEERTTG